MDDTLLVSVIQRLGDLAQNVQHLTRREPPALALPAVHLGTQVSALDVLHHDVVSAFESAIIENSDDVRVAQGSRGLSLSLKAVGKDGVVAQRPPQQLDGYVTLEGKVVSFVDLGHAALADLFDDLVLIDCVPDESIQSPPLRIEMQ